MRLFHYYGIILLPHVVHAQFRKHARRKQQAAARSGLRKGSITNSSHALTMEDERRAQEQDPLCSQAIQEYSDRTATCSCTTFGDGTVTVSCVYEDCDACYNQGTTEVCASLSYGVTLVETNEGVLSEIFYQECTEFTKGPSIGETICYSETPQDESLGLDFSCQLQLNDQLCNSCTDRCLFDCDNIPGESTFDLCSDTESPQTTPDSIFYAIFDTSLFNKCFRLIRREPNGVVAGTLTDPHIYTFDGLEYDCQGAGEFILAMSPQLEIQGRFSKVGTRELPASVTTGIVVAIEKEPTVQVSLLPDAVSYDCIPIFFLDGTEIFLFQDTGDQGIVIEVINDDEVVVSFVRASVEVTFLIRQSDAFGCFFTTFLYLPPELREDVNGLYGSPNQVLRDEWSEPSGTVFPLPTSENNLRFEPARDYCTKNWCIRSEQDSLFTYDVTEDFALYFDCDSSPYDSTILQQSIRFPTPELRGICGQDYACLIDGTVGDIEDTTVYLEDRQRLESILQELTSPPPVVPEPPPKPKSPPSKGKGSSLGRWKGKGKIVFTKQTKGVPRRERWRGKPKGGSTNRSMSMSMKKSDKHSKVQSMTWTKWKTAKWQDRMNKSMHMMKSSSQHSKYPVFGEAPKKGGARIWNGPPNSPSGPALQYQIAPRIPQSNFISAKVTKPKSEKKYGGHFGGTV
eukprot:scaffold116_cov165-Amphora_coffeaeformis.AAC.3